MDKRAVERYMPIADKAIQEVFLNKHKNLDSTYRSKMSAFGATVVMSGLLPALAYYEEKCVEVIELLTCMYTKDKNDLISNSLFETAKQKNIKELIINYSISLKLVMNLYMSED